MSRGKLRLVVLLLLLALATFCKKRSEKSKIQRFSFDAITQKMQRQCDLKDISLQSILDFFENKNQVDPPSPEKSLHISMGSWEYLYCLITDRIPSQRDKVKISSEFVIQQLKKAGVDNTILSVVKHLVDPENGVELKTFGQQGNKHHAKLILRLNLDLLEKKDIRQRIISFLPPTVGSEHILYFQTMKQDKLLPNFSFHQLPESFVVDENLKLNQPRGKNGVFISYKLNGFDVAVIFFLEDKIEIDLSAYDVFYSTRNREKIGESAISIGRIQGAHLHIGSAIGLKPYDLGGNLINVFEEITVIRREQEWVNGVPLQIAGELKVALNFQFLFDNDDQLIGSWDKNLLEPCISAVIESYTENAKPVFTRIAPKPKDAIRKYLAGDPEIRKYLVPLLGPDAPESFLKSFLDFVYYARKVPRNSNKEDGTPYYYIQLDRLTTAIYDQTVGKYPHRKTVSIPISSVDAGPYWQFIQPIGSFNPVNPPNLDSADPAILKPNGQVIPEQNQIIEQNQDPGDVKPQPAIEQDGVDQQQDELQSEE